MAEAYFSAQDGSEGRSDVEFPGADHAHQYNQSLLSSFADSHLLPTNRVWSIYAQCWAPCHIIHRWECSFGQAMSPFRRGGGCSSFLIWQVIHGRLANHEAGRGWLGEIFSVG